MSEPVTTIDPRFSDPTATAAGWAETSRALETAELFWISTVRADGRPHVTPIVAVWFDGAIWFGTGEDQRTSVGQEGQVQSDLLRDIFGNPFRPVTLAPSLLDWNDSVVVKLSQGIYEERAFDRLPILADALEDAGCDDQDILAHCREQGLVHVRGCWVVDLLLGKE